jgi:ribonuclease BN (tRNA processing enzyme)
VAERSDSVPVSVQFLGSGDAFGSGGRLQACLYVDSGSARFLLDCGASSLIGMKRWGVSPARIDAILITHLHGDHFGGIPFFILEAQLVSERTRPLVIAGPPGLESRVRDAQEIVFPGSSGVKLGFPIDYVELKPGESTTIGPLIVTAYPVVHASGAPPYALRVECGGRIIAYSGDTEWTDSLVRASLGADLFVCEAYDYDKKIKFHLDYRTLVAHQPELGCKRLILTHMNDDMLSRLGSIQVEVAEDGKQIFL